MSMAQSGLENMKVRGDKVSPWLFLLWLPELFSRFFLSSLHREHSPVPIWPSCSLNWQGRDRGRRTKGSDSQNEAYIAITWGTVAAVASLTLASEISSGPAICIVHQHPQVFLMLVVLEYTCRKPICFTTVLKLYCTHKSLLKCRVCLSRSGVWSENLYFS